MMLTTGRQGTGYRVQGTGKWQNPEPRTLNPERGVTLVEVLLAVVILSIGMVGVLRAYAASLSILEIARNTIDSLELAEEKMADIEETVIEEGGISSGASSGQFDGVFRDYAWGSSAAAASTAGLHALTLAISRTGDSRKFELVTYAEDKNYEPP